VWEREQSEDFFMRHLRFLLFVLVFQASSGRVALCDPSQVGGRTSPDGSEQIMIDLPGSEQLKNTGGRDGAGLCVFTSITHAGRWANETSLFDFQQKMKSEQGGGWPEKVDQMMQKYAPSVDYVQYSGPDPSIIKLALHTGRMPCVTYGYSPRYGGSGRISHMVNCVHLSEKWAAVLDNNFPGETTYEWMTPQEFQYRWQLGGGGWVVVVCHEGPPPIPVNTTQGAAHAVSGVFGAGPCPTCPGGNCPTTPTSTYEWAPCPSDATQIALLLNGKQIGSYSFTWGYYRPLVNGRWQPRCEPPIAPPVNSQRKQGCNCDDCPCQGTCPCADGGACIHKPGGSEDKGVEADKPQDQGCNYNRIPHDGVYTIRGVPVTQAEAHLAVGKGGPLTDDSAKWHLTLIGQEAECAPILQDLRNHPAFAPYRDKLLVQAYRPGAWATSLVHLENGGKPDIVLQQAPDLEGKGKVLLRLAAYQGAEQLVEAIRKADPNYDPSKDPKPKPEPAPNQPIVAAWKPDPVHICCGTAAVIFAVLAYLKKKG
jgi:hypothetical protein